MSLRDKLNEQSPGRADSKKALYTRFGVIDNPFPSAGQPTGHPRLEIDKVDDRIVSAIKQFARNHATQVIVIEGQQGVGKTNLLNYYQQELQDVYSDDETFYIIRYYPDPEPTFDAIVRRVFQELGKEHLEAIGSALAELDEESVDEVIEIARSYELRIVLRRLHKAAENDDAASVAECALEWLVGLRILNRHREILGVQFRLDTVESKTQALRDVVMISERLDLLKGIFLLLDELEKQDSSLSKTPVLRYLSAIRALIDALPRRLFLMLALTGEARRRYFGMLPAIAGRLQNRVGLQPLETEEDAVRLADFYIEKAKERASSLPLSKSWQVGTARIVSERDVRTVFTIARRESAATATEGVTPRDFLNRLHDLTERAFEGK